MEPFDGPATADNYYGGWVPPSEDAIDQFKASLPSPEVEDTAIFGGADLPEDAHPWKAVEKVSGQSLPPLNQGTVGACCGFGAVNAMLVTSAVEIANGEKEKWHLLSPSYIYGGSRVVIGGKNGRPPFNGDGSSAMWCAKFMAAHGVVSREQSGPYTEAQAKEWGKVGPPKELITEGDKHLIRGTAQVKTIEGTLAALAAGYGVQIASGAGFTQKRDADGFCVKQGVWQHSMAFIGYRGRSGKRPGILVVNSWGVNSATGPTPDMPHGGCFYISFETAEYILKSGDCWIYSNGDGFKVNSLDFSKLNF